MNKIKTIFDRDWEGNRGVIDCWIAPIQEELNSAIATEKLDGTNVRLTVRNGTVVRLEKRINPTKIQKQKGITEPWYKDADEFDPQDKYIWEAARNTDLSNITDGELSGEAVGEKIQGNPLNLKGHQIFLFSTEIDRDKVVFENAPTNYNDLKKWLPKQKSKFGNNCGIEGIVWHCKNGDMYKIKLKDFKL